MNIRDLQKEAHAIAQEKGWHTKKRTVGDLIALCHSELSEALEEYRAAPAMLSVLDYGRPGDKPEGFGIELADCIIRIAHMAEIYNINLEECLRIKMEYNRTRPHRHGGKAI